jgi:hypothetical protein
MKSIISILIAAASLVVSSVSLADLVTSADEITNAAVITFEAETPVTNAPGPIQIGGTVGMDITVSGDPNSGIYVNSTSWGLGSNGDWTQAKAFVGANSARPGSMTIAFNDGPVAQVGGFMNHAPSDSPTMSITAYDADMNMLETYDITADAVTPGATDDGIFRGFSRPSSDIMYFEIYGGVPVLDDLTLNATPAEPPAPVPTLGFWAMLTLVLLMLAGSMVQIRRIRQGR